MRSPGILAGAQRATFPSTGKSSTIQHRHLVVSGGVNAIIPVAEAATAELEPTGPDLRWDPPVLNEGLRLFVSNHPEGIGNMAKDPRTGKSVPWPPKDMEGKLWSEEGTGDDILGYQVYICHQNWYRDPIYIGLVVENLSPDVSLTVAGGQLSTLAEQAGDERENWRRLCAIGLRNAYGELINNTQAGFKALEETVIPCGSGERAILVWKLNPGASLGARASGGALNHLAGHDALPPLHRLGVAGGAADRRAKADSAERAARPRVVAIREGDAEQRQRRLRPGRG